MTLLFDYTLFNKNSFQFFWNLEASLYIKSFYMFKHNYYTHFGSRNIAFRAMYTSSTSVWGDMRSYTAFDFKRSSSRITLQKKPTSLNIYD